MGILHRCYQAARMCLRSYAFGTAAIHATKRVHLSLWRLVHKLPAHERLGADDMQGMLQRPITIFTTDYCMYVAKVYAHHLRRMGYSVSVTTQEPVQWGDGLHILVAAQLVQRLPARYVVVQMEQLAVSTWYGVHYHRIMCGAEAVLDYNRSNIEYLRSCRMGGVPVQYVPITILGDEKVQEPDSPRRYDVLFYGGLGSKRRRNALAFLQRYYKVEIIDNLFGEALHEALRSAKVVVNIHQYDKALLETTRLYECLSLGLFVVSEDSANSGDFPTLRENISWYAEGDWKGMVETIGRWLADDKAREAERLARYSRAAKEADGFEACFRAYLDTHR